MELQTNRLAAYASAGRSHELVDHEIAVRNNTRIYCWEEILSNRNMLQQINDGFEVAFNKSFVAIQSSNWKAAEQLLLTAERKPDA